MMIVDIRTDNPDHNFTPCQRMANAIIDCVRKNGGCLPQDLLPLGFTRQETLDCWHMANAMAAVELKLMKEDA
jgi:hypothetical protein